MARLGHEDIKTTLGTYGHLYDNTNFEVANNRFSLFIVLSQASKKLETIAITTLQALIFLFPLYYLPTYLQHHLLMLLRLKHFKLFKMTLNIIDGYQKSYHYLKYKTIRIQQFLFVFQKEFSKPHHSCLLLYDLTY